tara:strand:+ start:172 stop:510 length:339 start_codon:yes stop_codon:yes gene_type:complete
MANLQKHRAHESLNMDSAGLWKRGYGTLGASIVNLDVSSYHTVHLQIPAGWGMYFIFVTETTDVLDTASDLYLEGGDTIYSIKVPRGLGDTIYLQYERKHPSSNAQFNYVLS